MQRIARFSVVCLVGLATATGVGLGAAPASAASATVRSAIKAVPSTVDITAATVDYDRAKGRLAVTVVLRGAPGRGRGEGPTYSVLLYGPRNVTGGTGQSVISVASHATPGRGPLVFNPVGTDVDQLVRVDVRYVRNRVEFTATDDRLKNLPIRFFDVQTSLDRIYIASDFATTDRVRGRIGG